MKVCIPITKKEYDIQKALGSLPIWIQILVEVENVKFSSQKFDELKRWLLSLSRDEAKEKVRDIFERKYRNEIAQEWVNAIINSRDLVYHLVTPAEWRSPQKKGWYTPALKVLIDKIKGGKL